MCPLIQLAKWFCVYFQWNSSCYVRANIVSCSLIICRLSMSYWAIFLISNTHTFVSVKRCDVTIIYLDTVYTESHLHSCLPQMPISTDTSNTWSIQSSPEFLAMSFCMRRTRSCAGWMPDAVYQQVVSALLNVLSRFIMHRAENWGYETGLAVCLISFSTPLHH